MAKITILGSANAVADHSHENAHFAISTGNRFILIDCPNNPIMRLSDVGLDFHQLTDLILTHFHPDHVSGVPLLLMNMWLLGHRSPLRIHGLQHTIERMKKLMDLFDWKEWINFFEVTFHALPENNMSIAVDDDDFRIYTSPVCHMIPTMGMRVEMVKSGKVLAYSCDTTPCPSLYDLAFNADVLIHEAAGEFPGHSSAFQAGQVAQNAGAKSLYLIHYDVDPKISKGLTAQAESAYSGQIYLAEDFLEIDL
ncbi:MAG: MBL fold metallo-hydrolase [Chloroflexota bacterium]